MSVTSIFHQKSWFSLPRALGLSRVQDSRAVELAELKINHHRRRGIGDFRSAAIGRICHQFAIESSYIQLQSIIDHHYGGIALDISIQFCKGGIRHKFTMSAALSSTQSQFKVANIQGNKIFSDLEEMLIGNIWELFFFKVVVWNER